ncbi:hypothetical protein FKP32DRAFT_1589995 [Trametes sanguinea]|nr:hypothetical protein FKP32DRAFT_1589995 [Trametes sanguinea]
MSLGNLCYASRTGRNSHPVTIHSSALHSFIPGVGHPPVCHATTCAALYYPPPSGTGPEPTDSTTDSSTAIYLGTSQTLQRRRARSRSEASFFHTNRNLTRGRKRRQPQPSTYDLPESVHRGSELMAREFRAKDERA